MYSLGSGFFDLTYVRETCLTFVLKKQHHYPQINRQHVVVIKQWVL